MSSLKTFSYLFISLTLSSASSLFGMDHYVSTSAELQPALNAAQLGDNIILQAGVTFRGNFVLPEKPGKAWITIRSSATHLLPPQNTRVKPSDAVNMAKIMAPNTGAALSAAIRAHNYRIIGIEFCTQPGIYNWTVVRLGNANERTVDELPYNFDLDRVYIHGDPRVGGKRGVDLNSRYTTIRNSHISDFKSTFQDSQAIAGWNGSGPFLIENNYLEASAENVAFGGAVVSIPGLIPSDITLRKNHFYKPWSWFPGSSEYQGTKWWVKTVVEFKAGRRILVENNIFENVWRDQQQGFQMVIVTPVEHGKMRWNGVEDLTIRQNIFRHSGGGINIDGYDTTSNGGFVRRVNISNNIFEHINPAKYGGRGVLFQITNKVENLTVDHNTSFQHYDIMVLSGLTPMKDLVYTNNMTLHGTYGIYGGGTRTGNHTLNTYAPGAVMTKNIMVRGINNVYPAGNYFPAWLAEIGLVTGFQYRVDPASPMFTSGTDGKAIGADPYLVYGATASVVQR